MCSAWFSVLGKMENRRGTCPHENDISRYVSVFGTFSSHVVCETLCGCGKTPGSRSSLKEGMSVWAHSFRRISDHHGREGKVSGAIHPWQWVSVAAYSYHSGQEAKGGGWKQGRAMPSKPHPLQSTSSSGLLGSFLSKHVNTVNTIGSPLDKLSCLEEAQLRPAKL